jgi:hypothetical protein
MGAVCEDLSTFMTISRSILLRTRNVSNNLVDKIKTPFLCSITFFAEIMPFMKNMEIGKIW